MKKEYVFVTEQRVSDITKEGLYEFYEIYELKKTQCCLEGALIGALKVFDSDNYLATLEELNNEELFNGISKKRIKKFLDKHFKKAWKAKEFFEAKEWISGKDSKGKRLFGLRLISMGEREPREITLQLMRSKYYTHSRGKNKGKTIRRCDIQCWNSVNVFKESLKILRNQDTKEAEN